MENAFFSPCGIDQWTEIEAVRTVDEINYLIDNFVTSIVYEHSPHFRHDAKKLSPLETDN